MAHYLHPDAKELLKKYPNIKVQTVYPRERLKAQFESRRDPKAAVVITLNSIYKIGKDGKQFVFYDQSLKTKDKFGRTLPFNEQVGKYDNIELHFEYNAKSGDMEATGIENVFEDYTIEFSPKAVEDILKTAKNPNPRFYIQDGYTFRVTKEQFIGQPMEQVAAEGRKAIAKRMAQEPTT